LGGMLNVENYSEWLMKKLEVMHSIQRKRGLQASKNRKAFFDRKAVKRVLQVEELGLVRQPVYIMYQKNMTPRLFQCLRRDVIAAA